jgi:hypothetical protein
MLIPDATDKRFRSAALVQLHRADNRASTRSEILLQSLVPLRLDANSFQSSISISRSRLSTFLRRVSVLSRGVVVAYSVLLMLLLLLLFAGPVRGPSRRIPPAPYLLPRDVVKVIGRRGLREGF